MTRFLLITVLTVSLLGAGSAWASAGDDQYCDPFSGCTKPPARKNQTHHPKASPLKKPAQPEGVATGGSAQKADAVSPAADRFNQAVRRVMQQRQHGDKYQDAKRVLEAAGLSALAWTLP